MRSAVQPVEEGRGQQQDVHRGQEPAGQPAADALEGELAHVHQVIDDQMDAKEQHAGARP